MVIEVPELSNVTTVSDVVPLGLDANPLLTAVTVPVTLLLPPGLETNPTKKESPADAGYTANANGDDPEAFHDFHSVPL
jgi:hypothetical protein